MEDTAKKKVLIVDDDPAICRALEFKLQNAGFDIMVAHDGEEGLEQIVSYEPDVVLLDIVMPKLSGDELLNRYATLETAHKPKFIIVTNQDTMDTISKVFTHEVIDVISKESSSLDDIVRAVHKRA